MRLCIFLSLPKLEYGRYRFVEVHKLIDGFVGVSGQDKIQCHFFLFFFFWLGKRRRLMSLLLSMLQNH